MAKSAYDLENNNDAENDERADSQFAINDLKRAESLSRGNNTQSSTSTGKVSFNTSADASYKSGPSSTSTSPSKEAKYDTSGNVPAAEKSLYNSTSTKPGGLKYRNLLGTRRRKILFGGGVVSSGIALVIFLIGSGPLEFVHLSQVLQRNFIGTSDTIKIRNKGLLRFARTGNAEETRLGTLGSKVYNRTLSQLKDQGIEFDRLNGTPDSMTIDTSKNDSYRDLSPEEKRGAIIEDYKISDPSILTNNGDVYKINLDATSMKGIDFVNATAKTAIGSLNTGKIEGAMSLRYVRDAWGLPSLFHPLRKLTSPVKNKLSGLLTKQQADQAEKERTAAEETTVSNSADAEVAKSEFKDAVEKNQSKIIGALIATAGLCAIRSAADAAVEVNRAMIVLPATVQAADKIALGSQLPSGQDFDTEQYGAVKDTFTDSNGHSIWEGSALKATEGDVNPSGPDLWVKYKQAFDADTTADNIKDAIKINIPGTGVNITDAVCSKFGQFLQLVTGGVLLIINLPDGDAGAAAWYAAVAGVVKSAVAFGGVLYAIEHFGPDLISDKTVLPEVLGGPIGGNLLAYGARELSNVGARSLGGVALDNTNKTVLTYDEEQAYDQEFKQEGIAKRLFDTYDERSLISKLIDNVSPSLQGNIAKISGIFTNFGNMFAHPFVSVMPHAAAASGYDWGFPKYGFSQNLVEDKNYEDPYANGDKVAQMLDQQGCDNGCDTRNKVMSCFGVDINRDSDGKWQVVAEKDVNPDSSTYNPEDCANSSDSWNRIRLFILDSRIMDTIACHQGVDDQSCNNLDANGETPAAESTTGTNNTPPGTAIDTNNLYNSSVSTPCATGTKDLGIQDGYHDGQLVKIRVCAVSDLDSTGQESTPGSAYYINGANGKAVVNSIVSGSVYAMAQASKLSGVTLSANSAFRTMAHQQSLCPCDGVTVAIPGTSNHQMGLAIDFATLPSTPGPIVGNPVWDWLSRNAINFGYKNYPAEAWHWSPTGN